MRYLATATLLLASWLTACGDGDSDTAARDEGDIRVAWPEPDTPERAALRDELMERGDFEELADAFNAVWALPEDLTVRHEVCGEVNAFYSPGERSIRMCYELRERLEEVFSTGELISENPQLMMAEEEVVERWKEGTWRFIFMHELGHALISLYDLPVLGMEEDAADIFSTLTLIELGEVEQALGATLYWASTDNDNYSDIEYADSHGLNKQRMATILCMIYGSDPERFEVAAELFPHRDCEYEYWDKERDWDRLLAPWRL